MRRLRNIVLLLVLALVAGSLYLQLRNRAGPAPARPAPPALLAGEASVAGDPPTAVEAAKLWAGWARPPRVGLQVGHWKAAELPDELARFRGNTGTAGGGYRELEVNLKLAGLVKQRLEEVGVAVDLLPATVPIRYRADAFVAIHADGSWSPKKRGWKLATFWRPLPAAKRLARELAISYGRLDMPYDPRVTANMRGYFVFNRRHSHAIASTTPGVILELGFVTSPADRALLIHDSDRVAAAISAGIHSFLQDHGPLGPELLKAPPPLPPVRASAPISAYNGPWEGSAPIRTIYPAETLEPIRRLAGWYKVPLPPRWERMAWVRANEVSPALLPARMR